MAGLLEGNVGRYSQQEWNWYWASGVVTRLYARWLKVWALIVGKDITFLSSPRCSELAMLPTKPSFWWILGEYSLDMMVTLSSI
jgi:hypothetical protein